MAEITFTQENIWSLAAMAISGILIPVSAVVAFRRYKFLKKQ